jgi:hypothetical protein
MFFHRRQLRRWAARVLLVWLFGVAAGVANACLAPAWDDHGAQASVGMQAMDSGHEDAAIPQGHDAHDGATSEHSGSADHGGIPGKANCQDFCQKSTVSIPPVKSALDQFDAHALAPLAIATVVPVPAFQPEQSWLPRRDGGLAPPPITIAFLRLAL